MSNATLDLISRHGSVRKYRPDLVPVETIETIISAAQRTSTSSNLQAYSVVAVMDAAKRARLAELCGNQEHIAQAPLFLAWCADLARLDRACEMRGYLQETGYVENFLIAAVDAVIAAQTAALAAEALGLGICYIGSIRNNTQAVIELLELPRLVFPVTGMTVGWPAAEPLVRPRLPICRPYCTGSSMGTPTWTKRWPSTTMKWPAPGSTAAAKCLSRASRQSWRITAGPSTQRAAWRRQCGQIYEGFWRGKGLR